MDEYISREKAIETIQYRVCQAHGNKELICKRGSCAYCGIMEIMSDIESIKAADVQPVVHAKWEISSDGYYPYCSRCFGRPNGELTKYCPDCGARMIKDGDAE